MSVLGHVFEGAGISTVSVALVREHAEKVKPPRSLFVPFPYGHTLGKPNDAELQHSVIAAALDLLSRPSGPVLADFDGEGGPGLIQASAVQPSAASIQRTGNRTGNGTNPADELTSMRELYERWVADHDGRTMVGLSGIPQRRFRGTVRFLEEFAENGGADMKERPEDVSVPQYLRYCVDDIKAFYYEARMAQRSKATEEEIHTWFWGETAMAKLILDVAKRMNETDDSELKSFAYGLAR